MYPFKSLDGAEIAAVSFAERGGLRHDRMFAIVDGNGGFVNGKCEPRVHELRVLYDAALTEATFRSPRLPAPFRFAFADEPAMLERWLTRHFEREVFLCHDDAGGFPDDVKAPGPTVVSTATLMTVASWFPGLDAENVRARLRTNIEIGGVPAFWEDRLYTEAGSTVPVRIGEAILEGTNPCARCIVPSRDPVTGKPLQAFSKIVSDRRKATLPPWAERSRFDHYYRLTVNTRASLGATTGPIRVGDSAAVIEQQVAAR